MSDELILVAFLLGGIALMIAGIIVSQRGSEKKLRARARIELHFEKPIRVVLCIVGPLIVGTLLTLGVANALGDQARHHALAMTLFSISNIVVLFGVAFLLTRGKFRKGSLLIDESTLALTMDGERQQIDLLQPFVVREFVVLLHNGIQQEVLFVQQEGREVAFSYGLPIGRKPIGTQLANCTVKAQLGGAGRIVHERLIANQSRVTR